MVMAFSFRFLLAFSLVSGVAYDLYAAEDPALAPSQPPVTPKPATPETKPARPLAPAEYKRADTNAYPKAALLKARPGAVVIPKDKYEERDGGYWFTPKVRAPKELFFETASDWIEPITPPDMPATLAIAPDAMQIREPQGDVQVALPSAPGNFSPATENMALPNGAVVKTGANGTAAILFGGVDSARLLPNSSAAVQQTVTANARSVEVDLTAGGVFSKVGTQVGVAGGYEVHTPTGNAASTGGDFATIIASDRTDVWVAAGNVLLVDGNRTKLGEATAPGSGELKLLRTVPVGEAKETLQANLETLSAAINFVALANQKVKALREKQAKGETLTASQQAYLGRIRQVPYLMMLDLVTHKSAPIAATPKPAPIAATPPPQPLVTPILAPRPIASAPVPPTPVKVTVRKDGQVRYHGATIDLATFQSKVTKLAQATPDQPFVIAAAAEVAPEKVQAVQDALKVANFQNVTTKIAPPVAASVAAAKPAAPETTAAPDLPKPHMTSPTISTTDRIVPLEIDLNPHGKIVMEGQAVTLDQLKVKLQAVAAAIPDQPIVIRKDDSASSSRVEKVLAICHELKLKTRILIRPGVPAMETSAQPNPLAPRLRMDPTMQISSDTTPGPLPSSPVKPEASTSSP